MAGEKEKLHIRLHIYDTDMPVVIDRDDEFMYREAAKDINEAVNAYSEIFKGKKSDYEVEKSKNDTTPVTDILSKITNEIEETLNE